jgi:hypothetical protein
MGSILEARQDDQWASMGYVKDYTNNNYSKKRLDLADCAFEAVGSGGGQNLNCEAAGYVSGWPIIIKRRPKVSSFVVGLRNHQTGLHSFIDKTSLDWVAEVVAKSVEVKDLPSCRGPGNDQS